MLFNCLCSFTHADSLKRHLSELVPLSIHWPADVPLCEENEPESTALNITPCKDASFEHGSFVLEKHIIKFLQGPPFQQVYFIACNKDSVNRSLLKSQSPSFFHI